MFIHHSSFRDVYHYQLACSRGEQERTKELSESEVLHHRDSINSLWAVGLADRQHSQWGKMVSCRPDEVNLSHHWYNKNNNIISICFHSFLDHILFIYPINFKAPMHASTCSMGCFTFRRMQMEYFARIKS